MHKRCMGWSCANELEVHGMVVVLCIEAPLEGAGRKRQAVTIQRASTIGDDGLRE